MRIPGRIAQAEQTRFYSNAGMEPSRRIPGPSPARTAVGGEPDNAREQHIRYGVSLWDALILAACVDAGVDVLYSEDVPAVETFETVRVINPFK
jgi:hypothetical protein